jgi:hypothetical protein
MLLLGRVIFVRQLRNLGDDKTAKGDFADYPGRETHLILLRDVGPRCHQAGSRIDNAKGGLDEVKHGKGLLVAQLVYTNDDATGRIRDGAGEGSDRLDQGGNLVGDAGRGSRTHNNGKERGVYDSRAVYL